MRSVVLAVALIAFVIGYVVGASTAVVTADDATIIGADICCPQGSIPGCYCFPNVKPEPQPCPPGYAAIPGTDMCGVVVGGHTG